MKIPKTTPEKPYIEFRFDKNGKLHLEASASWWGGKTHSFTSSDGSSGNTCPPKQLKAYIEAFKIKRVKDIEKEIAALQKKLNAIKSQNALIDASLES